MPALVAIGLSLLAAAGCGGPLANVEFDPLQESLRRRMLTARLSSLQRIDATVRSWDDKPSDASPFQSMTMSLFGLEGAAAADVDGNRPVGIALLRADRKEGTKSVPGIVGAICFSLKHRDAKAWLQKLGEIEDDSRSFYLVHERFLAAVGEGLGRRTVILTAGAFWVHIDGDEVTLSGDSAGLLMAGPAARAARRVGQDDIAIRVFPPVWAQGQKQDLARWLASRLAYLRQGRVPKNDTRTAAILNATNAYYYLHSVMDSALTDVALKFDKGGVELALKTSSGEQTESAPDQPPAEKPAEPTPMPVLDRTLVGDTPPAALGALDCRGRMFVRQRALIRAWQETGGPGVSEMNSMVEVQEKALDGTCSFAVHTDNDLWAEEASYRLRAGTGADTLGPSMIAAMRSGGLPNLHSAQDDLTTAKLLLKTEDDSFGVDRVLGSTTALETRHAAALHGGTTLRDRYAIKGDRLLAVSGARAPERLQKLAQPATDTPLPKELETALSSGRGKAGYLFADMLGLWRPFLKAGLIIKSPLAEAVAKTPTLLKQRRPVVITLEPSSGLDARATMPPETFTFLFAAGALLMVD